jgi:hypothetical protein
LTMKRPDAPFELESVILRCLEKDPDGRYADVAELVTALAPVLPAEAANSIARIVRVLRGKGTASNPSISPAGSMRHSRPSLSGVGSASSSPNAETLFIEPSDQRRSGVGTKLRIRASSPSRDAAETMTAEMPVSKPPPPLVPSWRRNIVVGGVAFMAATAVFMWVARSPGPESRRREAASTASTHSGKASPDTESAATVADPSEPMTIEFVDVPAEGHASPASARADYAPGSRAPSKGLAKVDHADGGAKAGPPVKVGSGAVPIPSPSGTAAFGSARD